jgi:hypothetical protein
VILVSLVFYTRLCEMYFLKHHDVVFDLLGLLLPPYLVIQGMSAIILGLGWRRRAMYLDVPNVYESFLIDAHIVGW